MVQVLWSHIWIGPSTLRVNANRAPSASWPSATLARSAFIGQRSRMEPNLAAMAALTSSNCDHSHAIGNPMSAVDGNNRIRTGAVRDSVERSLCRNSEQPYLTVRYRHGSDAVIFVNVSRAKRLTA